MRAQSPSIDEAFRKFSLAVSLDGYQVERVDPAAFYLETGWRPAKEKEKSEADTKLSPGSVESKLIVRFDRRGQLYDVLCTPLLRYRTGEAFSQGTTATIHHPLWEKWERVLNSTLQKEAKEEE